MIVRLFVCTDVNAMDADPDARYRACLNANFGMAFTWTVDDDPICCGGVVPLKSGVGEAWLMRSPELERHAMSVRRAVREVIDHRISAMSLYRVQAVVPASIRLCRWLSHLDFVPEGIMRSYYGPGADGVLYALAREM